MTHWYNTDTQEPEYETLKKDGKGLRATTLADAKKRNNLVVGVTTICNIPKSEFLSNWQIDQILNAVLEHGTGLAKKNIEQWKGMIKQAGDKVRDDAANKGKEIHNKLEQYYLNELDGDEWITPVIQYIQSLASPSTWIPEASFALKKGFGGCVDLHNKKANIIIDFKTKNKSKEQFNKEKFAYDSHSMQLAAYREGLNILDAKCYNIFISTQEPGVLQIKEWTEEELQRAHKMFTHLLEYWKLANKL